MIRDLHPDNLKISARLVYYELIKRGIEAEVLSTSQSLIRYKVGDKWHFMHSTLSEYGSALALAVTESKWLTSVIGDILGWPQPATKMYSSDDDIKDFLAKYQKIVVKPLDGTHGDGVQINISDFNTAKQAITRAQKYSSEVLLQQMVQGDDVRVLCVDGKFISAVKRLPASVVGDGKSIVRQLIDIENQNPDRAVDYSKNLLKISIPSAEQYMGDKLDSLVPKLGEKVRVVGPANISLGGTVEDITESASQEMIDVAQSVARELKIGICGIDFALNDDDFYLIEVNVNPGIDFHDVFSTHGTNHAVESIVDYILANAKAEEVKL